VHIDRDGRPSTLLIAERFVRNQGDAWQWTLDALRRAIDPVAITGADEAGKADAIAHCLPLAAQIGKRLAELHDLLAQPTDDPAFAPEPVGEREAAAIAAEVAAEFATACQTLSGFAAWDGEEERAAAAAIVGRRDKLERKLAKLAQAAPGTLLTRIHGDFHLGQVLVTPDDAILIDFEGEPTKSLEERRAKSSPWRDVAGLLRSFAYVGATLGREPAPATEPSAERRDDLLRRYVAAASEAFLGAYRARAASSGHSWYPGDRAAAQLIDLFLLQKASYEIAYEAAHRPTWLGIPLHGLFELSERLLS